ncbi:MAG: hypothetical protein KBF82_07500 [Chitinophagaceae bacterium]|nr:hypothetical protein [Chitinophagaceae bacterium]MBP9103688.1 hypothetical protein [Chitinophagaceae bacterium]
MKKILSIALSVFFIHSVSLAQWPSNVKVVEGVQSDSTIVKGNLADGEIMEDLSWAANSSNACFVSFQNPKFRGNHVFFATTIFSRTELIISVKPTNDTANLSIYAYMQGADNYTMVPNLPSCITCEADYKWDRKWKGKTQFSERYVKFSNPTGRTYNILIGVSSPAGITEGEFELKIKKK